MDSLIGTIAIVALIIVVARQNRRIGLLEREIGALRSFVLESPSASDAKAAASSAAQAGAEAIPADEIVAETAAVTAEAARCGDTGAGTDLGP